MAGGVAVPLKPKTKMVWGKRPHVDDEGDVDPGASSSGQPRTEPGPDRGAGSGKDDDMTLPDIGKLSVTEKKKDDMDVDQEGSKKDSTETKSPRLGVLRLGRQTRVRSPTSKGLPSRSTGRLLLTMSTAGREMIGGSFPRTLL